MTSMSGIKAKEAALPVFDTIIRDKQTGKMHGPWRIPAHTREEAITTARLRSGLSSRRASCSTVRMGPSVYGLRPFSPTAPVATTTPCTCDPRDVAEGLFCHSCKAESDAADQSAALSEIGL